MPRPAEGRNRGLLLPPQYIQVVLVAQDVLDISEPHIDIWSICNAFASHPLHFSNPSILPFSSMISSGSSPVSS